MNLPELNFSERYQINFIQKKGIVFVHDFIRKKEIQLTPEEWIRQHWLHYLVYTENVNPISIQIEKQFSVQNVKKRFDVVVFEKLKPKIIIECKSPWIEITQQTFEQIARYNLSIQAQFIILSNGLQHIFFEYNTTSKQYIAIQKERIFQK